MYEQKVSADESYLDKSQSFNDGDKSVITTHDIGIKAKRQNLSRSKSHESNRVLIDGIDYKSIQETKSNNP